MNQIELQKKISYLRRHHDIKAWRELKNHIESNPGELSQFSTRWLVSIADTYADFGDSGALLIVLLANLEKLARTLKDPNWDKTGRKPISGGMSSFTRNGDMILNMVNRIFRQLESPMSEVFAEVFSRLAATDGSILNQISQKAGDKTKKAMKKVGNKCLK